MAPYITVAVPPMMAAMYPPAAAGGGEAAAPIPMMHAPGYEAGNRDKVYSPFEHERIRTACGLSHANYEASRPPIYAAMLTEGRTMAKVEAVLQRFFEPIATHWDPVKIYVSTELTRDVRTCASATGMRTRTTRAIAESRRSRCCKCPWSSRTSVVGFKSADRATLVDRRRREMEAEPGSCPSTYFTMGLSDIVGQVRRLRDDDGGIGRGTLWHVFIDAREYFSYTGPGLPDSQLFALRDCLRSCSLKVTINCPVYMLLGRPAPSVAAVVSRTGSAGGGGRGGSHGSGGSASTMSTLTGSAAASWRLRWLEESG
ncbi:hypothetical protein MHU86_11390 [Fragilaria crotonensis]|nr:hypothetical protein MHU86_11390 [Fragilaria crotonensis]